MESNKAPEKIYLDADENWHRTHTAYTEKAKGNDIEYTRTDAFIEKACEKLKKCMYDNLMFQGRLHREEVIETFVRDFKKYMEEQQ